MLTLNTTSKQQDPSQTYLRGISTIKNAFMIPRAGSLKPISNYEARIHSMRQYPAILKEIA